MLAKRDPHARRIRDTALWRSFVSELVEKPMKLYRVTALIERDMRKFFRSPALMLAR